MTRSIKYIRFVAVTVIGALLTSCAAPYATGNSSSTYRGSSSSSNPNILPAVVGVAAIGGLIYAANKSKKKHYNRGYHKGYNHSKYYNKHHKGHRGYKCRTPHRSHSYYRAHSNHRTHSNRPYTNSHRVDSNYTHSSYNRTNNRTRHHAHNTQKPKPTRTSNRTERTRRDHKPSSERNRNITRDIRKQLVNSY